MGSEGPHPSWGALGQGRHLILYRSEKAFSAPGMGALGREVMWKGTQSLVSAGMLSAGQVSTSDDDTSSSSDETDVEVTATRPQACLSSGLWPSQKPC